MSGDHSDGEAIAQNGDGEPTGSNDPWLVVLCGLPGVGKSTVGALVAERLGARRLRTDVVRKELYDDPQYTDEEMASVYRELLDRSRQTVEAGESVVLDGTFAERGRRRTVREIAAEATAEFRLLEVVCERSVAEERIADREGDMSDADVAVYRKFREEFHPIEMYHVAIDNSGTEEETREQVARTIPES